MTWNAKLRQFVFAYHKGFSSLVTLNWKIYQIYSLEITLQLISDGDLITLIVYGLSVLSVTVLTSTVIFSLGADLDLSNCWLLYREIKLNYGTLDPWRSN